MTPQEPIRDEQGQRLLQQVNTGMTAYDNDNEKVGEVDRVYFGAKTPSSDVEPATAAELYQSGRDTVSQSIADLFDSEEIPETVAERLLHSGFLHLDGVAVIGSDHYVFPDQIAAVSEDEVHLSVSSEELLEDRW